MSNSQTDPAALAIRAALVGPPKQTMKTCKRCGGYGFIAEKHCIDDGWGEVDSCPDCTEITATALPDAEPVPLKDQIEKELEREAAIERTRLAVLGAVDSAHCYKTAALILLDEKEAALHALQVERDQLKGWLDNALVRELAEAQRADDANVAVAKAEAERDRLKAELETVITQRDKWLKAFNESEQFQNGPIKRAERAEAQHADLVAALREWFTTNEWIGESEHVPGCCQSCDRFPVEGHDTWCPMLTLKALLSRVPAQTEQQP